MLATAVAYDWVAVLLGTGVPLILAIVCLAVTLRFACWATNSVLSLEHPRSEPQTPIEERTYRTVEAGPFTSPGTAQLTSIPTTNEASGVPEPHFLHATGIAFAGLIGAGLALWGLVELLYPPLYRRDPASFWILLFIITMAQQYLLNTLLLPTTWLRGAVVTFLQAVSLVLLWLVPALLIGAFALAFRSA